jgi:predicted permease
MSELTQAVRALCRIPGTVALSIVTLGLGIGATTTTFSAAYAAWLRPIPFDAPGRLAYLQTTRQTQAEGTTRRRWSYALAADVRRHAGAFSSVATFTRTSVGLSAEAHGKPTAAEHADDAEHVDGEIISAGYFESLRVSPVLGRVFTGDEESPGHPVAVIAYSLWRARFGSDRAIVGQSVTVNGVPLAIAGVMPPGFNGVSERAQIWVPAGMAPSLTYRDYLTTPQLFINVIGRLRDGVTFEHTTSELAALARQLPFPAEPDGSPVVWSATAIPLGDAGIDPRQRRALRLLLAASAGLLLVTCVNVSLLLLARARDRRGEMAIRVALGASRGQVARQVLAETALLAAGGGAAGSLWSFWGVAWLRRVAPNGAAASFDTFGQVSSFSSPAIDGVSLACAAGVAATAVILVGLAPALLASQANPAAALSQSSRTLSGRGVARAMSALVVTQIAAAVLMLSGALLLLHTVHDLQAGRSGFDERALSFWIDAPASRYAAADGPAVVERVLDRIGRVPGVVEAGVNRCTPYGASCARSILFIAGRSIRPQDAPPIGRHYVSSGYFRAAGIALRRGRLIADDDRADRPPVVVINETAARRFWPNEDPIGKRVWFGGGSAFMDPAHALEIVGIVADVKYWPPNEPVGPDFYTSYLQFAWPSSMYVVKLTDAQTILPAIRRAVSEIDAALAIYDVQQADERVSAAVAPARFIATVTAFFGAAAASLAALGVFSVMAYSVSARREELALRLALGASPSTLTRGVLRTAVSLAIRGGALGLLAAVWLLPALRAMLYGISPLDPFTLMGSVAAMASVAVVSAAIPAARATAVDPLVMLRRER